MGFIWGTTGPKVSGSGKMLHIPQMIFQLPTALFVKLGHFEKNIVFCPKIRHCACYISALLRSLLIWGCCGKRGQYCLLLWNSPDSSAHSSGSRTLSNNCRWCCVTFFYPQLLRITLVLLHLHNCFALHCHTFPPLSLSMLLSVSPGLTTSHSPAHRHISWHKWACTKMCICNTADWQMSDVLHLLHLLLFNPASTWDMFLTNQEAALMCTISEWNIIVHAMAASLTLQTKHVIASRSEGARPDLVCGPLNGVAYFNRWGCKTIHHVYHVHCLWIIFNIKQ